MNDNDRIMAHDLVDWSDDRWPQPGELVRAIPSPLLFPQAIAGQWYYGIVIDLGISWMTDRDKDSVNAEPTWHVMWSNPAMSHYLREIGPEWITSGYIERIQ